MNPPVFRVANLDAASVDIEVRGDEARHAVGALRVRMGEVIDIVDGRGLRARTTVSAVHGPDHLTCTTTLFATEPPPRPFVTVIQALIKEGELAVDLLTQAGVDRIVPWSAERSVVQWRGERVAKGRAKWQSAADQAAKQSRRAWWPAVTDVMSTREVLAEIADAHHVWLLDASGATDVTAVPDASDLVVIVGPEGDVTSEEASAFLAAGAHPVRVGPRIWRSASAGMAALAVALTGSRNVAG